MGAGRLNFYHVYTILKVLSHRDMKRYFALWAISGTFTEWQDFKRHSFAYIDFLSSPYMDNVAVPFEPFSALLSQAEQDCQNPHFFQNCPLLGNLKPAG